MSNNDISLKSLDEALTEFKELEDIPEDLAEVLDAIECQRINKIDAIAYAINTLKYWVEIRETESKRLAELAKQDKAKLDWLKDYLKDSMERNGEASLKTKNFNIAIRTASVQAIECDLPIEEVPEKYLRLNPQLNKTLLKEDFKAGKLPPVLKEKTWLKPKTTYVAIQ
jgi:hypothetical protein